MGSFLDSDVDVEVGVGVGHEWWVWWVWRGSAVGWVDWERVRRWVGASGCRRISDMEAQTMTILGQQG
jgi:hypothetical protein